MGGSVIPAHFQWNEAQLEHGDPLNLGLVSLLVIRNDLTPQLVGTAFLVTADGNRATAVSAAHCFEEVRKLLHPNQLHHTSTLPEFLPPPKEIDLKQVKAVYIKGDKVAACQIEIAIWDSATDLAVFTLLPTSVS